MEDAISNTLEIYKFLKNNEFFNELNRHALWPIADIAVIKNFDTDNILIEEGNDPAGVFIIMQGKVCVYKTDVDHKDTVITDLLEGEIIGEISVIDQMKTTASVKAIVPTQCIFISPWDFKTQIQSYPEIAIQLLTIMARRLRYLLERI